MHLLGVDGSAHATKTITLRWLDLVSAYPMLLIFLHAVAVRDVMYCGRRHISLSKVSPRRFYGVKDDCFWLSRYMRGILSMSNCDTDTPEESTPFHLPIRLSNSSSTSFHVFIFARSHVSLYSVVSL